MNYGLFINFFNEFCYCDGITNVLTILSLDTHLKVAKEFKIENYKPSLEFIICILTPFKTIKPIAVGTLCKTIVDSGFKPFLKCIELLEEKDFKDISANTMTSFMDLLENLCTIAYMEEDAKALRKNFEMLLTLKFIKGSSLGKRLTGLNEIKKIIDSYQGYYPYKNDAIIKEKDLCKWIIENEVLESILNVDPHKELIRRSICIVSFLVKQTNSPIRYVELLWKCQEGRHEDIMLAVYDTLSELISFLNLEAIHYIFKKIKEIPIEKYNEKILNFMRTFMLDFCP